MAIPVQARAVGFVMTADRDRAMSFYADVLGLRLQSVDGFAAVYDGHGMILRLSFTDTFTPGPHPVIGWAVPDLTATARDLQAKGVAFEIYDGFDQDDLGIWTSPDGAVRVNWFKDPEGNLLSLTET